MRIQRKRYKWVKCVYSCRRRQRMFLRILFSGTRKKKAENEEEILGKGEIIYGCIGSCN